ncbi:MAG TPA: lactate utilization protein [Pyrinomonadaceae bacterium]
MNKQPGTNGRPDVLAQVRRALGRAETVRPEPLEPFVERADDIGADELVARFTAELSAVGAHVHRAASESEAAAFVARVCAEAGAGEVALSGSPLVAELGLAAGLAARGLQSFHVTDFAPHERAGLIARLEGCGAGVTAADYAIAETGTLVLTGDEEGALLASLLPAVHIALLLPRQIGGSLAEVVGRLKRERMGRDLHRGPTCRSATFITGPSRTSDVELVLSIGVHGPKQLHVVIIGS